MTRKKRWGLSALVCALFLPGSVFAQRAPIIDAHMHTPANVAPGRPICAGALDPNVGAVNPFQPDSAAIARCGAVLISPESRNALFDRTHELYRRFNVVAAVGSDVRIEPVLDWKRRAGLPMLAGYALTPGRVSIDSLRALISRGQVQVLGELGLQYAGMTPNDSIFEPYLSLAEEMDIPVGVHMGPGFPVGAVAISPRYRPSLGNPLLWEEALARHPRLRLVIQHAGWPMLAETLYLLFAFPNVYVDIGLISWLLPRAEFHRYLRGLVDAGFGKRIMYGSDGYIWPDAIELSIRSVEEAAFLTVDQKRDIFYNNAVRFYRLADEIPEAETGGT